VVALFQKREIFTSIVIDCFSKIGNCIIASAVISSISLIVYKAVENSYAGISTDFGGYDSFLIAVSLGLFFMVISEIFKIAKSMKEESELTI
jgi:urea transporter